MPSAPDNRQYKGKTLLPSEPSGIVTRSKSASITSATPPPSQNKDSPQSLTPAKVVPGADPSSSSVAPERKNALSPSPLHKIATALAHVIAKHPLPGQTKTALTEIHDLAKKEYVAEERAKTYVPMKAVKSLHDQFKADLVHAKNSIETKILNLQHEQRKLMATTDSLSLSTENLRTTTKDLETKVSKVNDSTEKLTNTTLSYRDALLAKPDNINRSAADPKILINADRRSRQILLGYNAIEENATLNTSLLELKEKANKVIIEMDDPSRPESVLVESVTRIRNGSLLLLLNSKVAADWLRQPDLEDKFLDKFAIGACFKDRSFNILLRWVPIILDPNNRAHHRELEEANGLTEHSIQKMRWIKPIIRRRAGQTKAHATITLTSADVANKIIRDGIIICGAKVRAERAKQEPIQCLKCRGWEHKADACPAQQDTCGTCGESHRTSACTAKDKLYCVSCHDNTHASWDRLCPEFRRRCVLYDERYPENKMVYFPTDQDWTMSTKPARVPLEERFPAHFAVNSLPTAASRRQHRPTVRLPPRNFPGSNKSIPMSKGKQKAVQPQHHDDGVAEGPSRTRSQSKLVPLGRGREEGELSDYADFDSFLEHQDIAFVEAALNAGPNWRAEPPGSWDEDEWTP